ncbi:MBL fold metallo-hydrolase [Desulfococcaceae bacterium HSG8]|nr:MBL fold metallo-hydrolase [Desulfococcaceae bacterium HSG8]
MKVRLTILCENSVGIPFGGIGEHGFACYVETEQGNYLFDTGQGFGIVQNSLVLNKDLRQIRSVMISHGHYDHTGGLPAVLNFKGPVDVFGHPDMFLDRFWSDDETSRFIGIPYRRAYLESLGANFRMGTEMAEIGPGVYLTGEIPRTTSFEKGDANMISYTPEGEKMHPDPIRDDLSMIIDSDKGLILVLGCAHSGMVNIIEYVMEKMQKDRIYAIIGGTHLGFSSEEQFDETLNVIDHYQIERMGVSHCTGLIKASLLHAKLKERFFFGCVGAALEG